MMNLERLKRLLERLLEKSRKNEVRWNANIDGSFSVLFPSKGSILINAGASNLSPEWASAYLVTSMNRQVLGLTAEHTDPDYPLLISLYEDAQRSFEDWDSSFAEIEEMLADDGVVGEVNSFDDDIPF